MAIKKYLSLERLTEYDELIKEKIDTGDASVKSYVDTEVAKKASSSHTHDDRYYTETEIDGKLSTINTSISNIASGTTPVKEAEHATTADSATNATSATKATQDGNGKVIADTYETKTDASAKLSEAKAYADSVGATIKNDLLNGAGTAYDTLKELGDLIDDNVDAIEALETVASGKADANHNHAIADVTGLQSALDGKAASSHGTHVTFDSTNKPKMDGTAAFGTSTSVARADHIHPTDTSRASKTEFDAHEANTTKHITSDERTTWNDAYTHSQEPHAPSDAEKNQNAFTNIKIGDKYLYSKTTTDTLEFSGYNANLSTTESGDRKIVNISIPDATSEVKGAVLLSDSVSSLSSNTAATSYSVSTAYSKANQAKTAADNAQTTADGKADISHTHKVADITDLTATATELNYMDGVTSSVQTQLDNKAASGHTHNDATTSAAGFMTATMVTKLNGIATGANKTIVDTALSSTSTNPVQNKVINSAITTLTSTVSANTSSINSHSTAISNLQTSVSEIQEITSEEIQALFA